MGMGVVPDRVWSDAVGMGMGVARDRAWSGAVGMGVARGSGLTRRRRLRGRATARSPPVGAKDPLPGDARCSRMVLHLPLPSRNTYPPGVGE